MTDFPGSTGPLGFFRRFFRRRPYRAAAHQLYVAAAEQSRHPALYETYGIPDTLDGRFDALVLHVFLILHRLRRQGDAALELGHEVVEVLVGDMDRTLRETGIADVGVGKRVKTMLKAFYGRIGAYDSGLSDTQGGLEDGLLRNIYRGDAPGPEAVAGLADYVRYQAAVLAEQPLAAFLAGEARFADHFPTHRKAGEAS